jgi:serine/threonine protein kinase
MLPGSKIGPYEIIEPIGRGGMGEVYRAHDARLRRDVAIKTVASGALADPAMRDRFEREARAVAALSHSGLP